MSDLEVQHRERSWDEGEKDFSAVAVNPAVGRVHVLGLETSTPVTSIAELKSGVIVCNTMDGRRIVYGLACPWFFVSTVEGKDKVNWPR